MIRAGAALAALALLVPAASSEAARRAPKPQLTALRCVPASAAACRKQPSVQVGKQVQLRGRSLVVGQRVTFRWSRGALATKLHRSRAGWVARVPPGTRAGSVAVTVRDKAGRRSNALKLRVLAPPAPKRSAAPAGPGTLPDAFRGQGMWIWQLPKTEGGNVDAIAARAQSSRITSVFVKSSDGTTRWDQFSPALVQALHDRGLRACAWQFVYGDDPGAEAALGADAVAAGADCLVIDAESKYSGRYSAAQTYLQALRGAIGPAFPVGFTSFPYVDYHQGIPYSVFLGAGGAQANVPQVYWKAIGDSVDAASAHTLAQNRIYGVPIAPLGQTYDTPSADELQRFRAVWASYGAAGLSWWSWQSTAAETWPVLGQPDPAAAQVGDPGWPVLGKGAKSDQVVKLQQHLASADPSVAVDGSFDDDTDASLRSFQASRGIPVTGTTDPATWQALLALPPRVPDWTTAGAPASARSASAAAAAPDAAVARR